MSVSDVIILGFEKRYRNKREEHWVRYASRANVQNAQTWDNVARLIPPSEDDDGYEEIQRRDPTGTKLMHMNYIWDQIQPAYEAWKRNEEVPETGVPLSGWAGVNKHQAAELRKSKIRTVEELAAVTDGQIQSIQLPDVQSLRKQAKDFVSGKDKSEIADELAKAKEQLSSAIEMMAEMRLELDNLKPPSKRAVKQVQKSKEVA